MRHSHSRATRGRRRDRHSKDRDRPRDGGSGRFAHHLGAGACPGQQCARDEIVLRVVIINGLAAILFMMGYAPLDIAMMRTATLPRGPVCWLRWARRHIRCVSG
jgi:hypothetical protein